MPESIKVRKQPQAHCKDCSRSGLCLPLSLNMQDMEALDHIVKRGRPLKKGEMLFRQGDAFSSVFAIRSGALRTFSVAGAGEEQITGFHMPSDEIGSYLGLAVETVSRVFTRCQANGLLEAEGKEVRILNSIRLCALAGGNMDA